MRRNIFIRIFIAIFLSVIINASNGDPLSGRPCAVLDTGSSSICISIEDINSAFKIARLAIGMKEPMNFLPHTAHQHHHQIDKLGNILVETSRILARNYKLDHEQIYDFLPKLDVELTDIWKFCPAISRPKICKVSKYRTLSGHCNNLNHPEWGAALSPFRYMLPPERHDGIGQPRELDKHLDPLPSPRVVSAAIHRDKVIHDHAITTMLIAWGQIVDHDITFTGESKDIITGKDPECCSEINYDRNLHHNCFPIRIPPDDPFYADHNQRCMSFVRSYVGVRTGCKLGPRTAFNSISSFLDANFLYGINVELAKKLRTGKHGTLKTLPLLKDYGLKELLPLKVDEPDDGCIRPNSDIFCFLAGDVRVNEQLVLTTLHTIFLREHNKIARSLAEINQHWDDEKIYQETRRIVIAIIQHITYNEFLPMILGKSLIRDFGLSVDEGYWTGYDPHTNPTAAEEFVTSAFRFGHSLLPEKIERWTTSHHYVDSTKLHEMLRQPFDMFRPGYADSYMMGLVNQLAQMMDEGVTNQVTTLLFKERNKHFGMDLAAINIQRGRDHGVLPFAAYRKLCDLSPISEWDDLIGVMRNETVYKYKQIYRSPWDIDLWSGGVSELSKDGALLGPTFGCLIAKQFHALRYGDRFWYELPDLPSSFTTEQLHEIKGMKLSRLICDNGDDIKSVQVYSMVHADHRINPRVSCYSQVLPQIDLGKWKDLSETRGKHTAKDTEGHQSVLQKAHLSTNLDVIKPPLYDSTFLKYKNDGKSCDKNPEAQKQTEKGETQTMKPFSYEKYVPPFAKIPLGNEEINQLLQSAKRPHNGAAHYLNRPYYNYNYILPYPGPYRRPHRPRPKPSLFSLVKSRNNFFTKIFRRRRKNKPYRHHRHYSQSQFPGRGGTFNPNPVYLVRQKYGWGAG